MRLTINLTTRSSLDWRLVDLLSVATLVILSVLLAFSLKAYLDNRAELADINRTVRGTAVKGGTNQSQPEKELKQIKDDIDFANNVIARKCHNHLELLERLERATPAGVVLTSLRPPTREGGLTLEGQVAGFSTLKQYLKKLHEAGFHNPLLLSQTDNPEDDGQSMQFSIACKVAAP